MIRVEPHPDGAVVWVRVQPGARKTGVKSVLDGELKLAVAAPAEKGRANQALVDCLARLAGVGKSSIEILSGRSSPRKRLLIHGANPTDLARRLEEAADRAKTG